MPSRLRDSRRVLVFGRGHVAALSSLIALRLNRSGYQAIDLASQMNQLAEVLATLSAGDVVWLLAFRRAPPLLQEVRDLAAKRQAKTIAVTDVGGLGSTRRRIIKFWYREASRESRNLVVPMTIANAGILDLASIDEGRSINLPVTSSHSELHHD